MAKGKPKPGKATWQKPSSANEKRTFLADEFAKDMVRALQQAKEEGIVRKNQFATWLNENGYETRRGRPWTRVAVKRLFARLEKLYNAGWTAE